MDLEQELFEYLADCDLSDKNKFVSDMNILALNHLSDKRVKTSGYLHDKDHAFAIITDNFIVAICSRMVCIAYNYRRLIVSTLLINTYHCTISHASKAMLRYHFHKSNVCDFIDHIGSIAVLYENDLSADWLFASIPVKSSRN